MQKVDREKLTPMMQQYYDIKIKHPDAILLFRLGDFYELFFQDAVTGSRVLDIVLTARNCGLDEKIPMCGFPHHSAEDYINKLVSTGHKVAICEQLEDPKDAKGIVERDVIQVLTPGTTIENEDSSTNNFLLSVFIYGDNLGLAYGDVSVGDIYFSQERTDDIDNSLQNLLVKLNPAELILVGIEDLGREFRKSLEESKSLLLSNLVREDISKADIESSLLEFLDEEIYSEELELWSSMALLNLYEYVYEFQKDELAHFKDPIYIKPEKFMEIDGNSRINLEIIDRRDRKYSLYSVLNQTFTPMGARQLHNRLEYPLLDQDDINTRLDIVEAFFNDSNLRDKVAYYFPQISDLERILGRFSYSKGNAKDLNSLKYSLEKLPDIKNLLLTCSNSVLNDFGNDLDTIEDIYLLVDKSIVEEPPTSTKEGKMIKVGYSAELDKLRSTSRSGEEKLLDFEKNQREKTGINSLKIVFNKSTGYFIDVTKANASLVPEDYHKVQTLTNSDRYITNELKEIETMIATSEDESMELEEKLFEDIKEEVLAQRLRIQKTAVTIGLLDLSQSLAAVAVSQDYVRPNFHSGKEMSVDMGRHPIIENAIGKVNFIANSSNIGSSENLFQIITGPNMSGKSTYLRQIALISIMAQIGSFVPAERADLPLVDKVFTRIGASDNIAMGESTFMVEMKEMSYILKNASENSLILLDEVGRGTSTYDGLSIAWAIVEYLTNEIKAKAIFATHYHELTKLEDTMGGIKNFQVKVEEDGENVIFLYKIKEGRAAQSFGIQVANMAGFPQEVTNRARTVLNSIEHLSAFEINQEVLEEQVDFSSYQKDSYVASIASIDIDELSPIEALNKLNSLVEEAKLIGD